MKHTIVAHLMAIVALDLPIAWNLARPSVLDMLTSESSMEQSAIAALPFTLTLSVKAMRAAAIWRVLRAHLRSAVAPIF